MEERDFGWALRQLKQGKRVARSGWNGKGMWLTIQSTSFYPEDLPEEFDPDSSEPVDRCILMFTAGATFIPWLASQSDMLSSDWEVLDD